MLRCWLRTRRLYPPQPRPPHALLCSARPSFPGSTTHDARPADRHAPRTAPRTAHAPEPRAPPPSWGLRAPWRRGRWGPRCCVWAAPWSAPSCSRRPTGTGPSWRTGRPPREGPRPGPRTRTRSSRRAVSGAWARLARPASSDGRGAQWLPPGPAPNVQHLPSVSRLSVLGLGGPVRGPFPNAVGKYSAREPAGRAWPTPLDPRQLFFVLCPRLNRELVYIHATCTPLPSTHTHTHTSLCSHVLPV